MSQPTVEKIDQVLDKSLTLHRWRHDLPSFFHEIADRYGYVLPPKHEQFLKDMQNLSYNKVLVCCGRTTAKTHLCGVLTLWVVIVLPYFLGRPLSVNILSGSIEQSRTLYEYFRMYLKSHPLIASELRGEPRKTYTSFKDGSWVKALPASERTVLSQHSDVLIIDEAGIKHLADGKLINDAKPLIYGSPNPRFLVVSSPYPYSSLFVDMWNNKDGKYGDFKRYHWSELDCPWISKDTIEDEKRTSSEMDYSIKVLGVPYLAIGKMFQVDYKRHVGKIELFKEGSKPICNIDWGQVNPTGLLISQSQDNKLAIIEEKLYENEKFPEIHKDIDRLADKYGFHLVRADSEDIGENQRLAERGFEVEPVVFKNLKGRLQGICRNLFEKDLIVINETCINLLQQLRSYSHETKRGDDLVDALFIACKSTMGPSTGKWHIKTSSHMRKKIFGDFE